MFTKQLLPAFSWMALIFAMCLVPGGSLPRVNWMSLFSIDKLVHVGMFVVLVVLLIVGFRKQYNYQLLRSRAISVALLISFLYGIVIELLQAGVIFDRTADVNDVIANVIGAFLGVLLFRFIYGKEITAGKKSTS